MLRASETRRRWRRSRLVRAHMEKERREQAEAHERNRGPARLEADEHENPTAEVGQDDERQESRSDAVSGSYSHLGVVRDLIPAVLEEDVNEHRSSQEDERPGEAAQERQIPVDGRGGRPGRGFGRGELSARQMRASSFVAARERRDGSLVARRRLRFAQSA